MAIQSLNPVAIIIVAPHHKAITINPNLLTALKKANIKNIVLLPLKSYSFLREHDRVRLGKPEWSKRDAEAMQTVGLMAPLLLEGGLYFVAESTALRNKKIELAKSHGFIVEDHQISAEPEARITLNPTTTTEPDAFFMEKFKRELKIISNNRYIIYNLNPEKVKIPSIAPNIKVVNVVQDSSPLEILNATKLFRLNVACENYLAHLKKLQSNTVQNFTNQAVTASKKELVEKLLALTSSPDSLTQFETMFKENRKTIEERRDTETMIFLKVLLSIFTLGIAPLCGLWKVKGQQVAQELDMALNPSIQLKI